LWAEKGNLMKNTWMVRAGEGGRLIDEFAKGYIAVGWQELGDMTKIKDQDKIRSLYLKKYPNEPKGAIGNSIAMFYKFRSVFEKGEAVISYDTGKREYLVGTIQSEYKYKPGLIGDYPHYREVKWAGRVSRDALSAASRNSLGSTLTLFTVNSETWVEIQAAMKGKALVKGEDRIKEEKTALEEIRQEIRGKAHEFIKDKILTISPDEMEE
jgi:restriction system protein